MAYRLAISRAHNWLAFLLAHNWLAFFLLGHNSLAFVLAHVSLVFSQPRAGFRVDDRSRGPRSGRWHHRVGRYVPYRKFRRAYASSRAVACLQSLLLDEQHYELVEANESEREPKDFNESYDDLPAYVRSLQNSPAPSFVVDGNMRIVLWSDGMYHATGLSGEACLQTCRTCQKQSAAERSLSVRAVALLSQYGENEHIAGAPLIFQIATTTRPCYLAMTASLLGCLVIVQGREQDPNLTQLAAPSLVSGSSFDVHQDAPFDDAFDPELTGREEEHADRGTQHRVSDLFAVGRSLQHRLDHIIAEEVMSDRDSLNQSDGAVLDGFRRRRELRFVAGALPPILGVCGTGRAVLLTRGRRVRRLSARGVRVDRPRHAIANRHGRSARDRQRRHRSASDAGARARRLRCPPLRRRRAPPLLPPLPPPPLTSSLGLRAKGSCVLGADATVESYHLVGRDRWTKETDDALLASGEIEVDERGNLRRWMSRPGSTKSGFEEGRVPRRALRRSRGPERSAFRSSLDSPWNRGPAPVGPGGLELAEIPLDVLDYFFEGADIFVEGVTRHAVRDLACSRPADSRAA